MCTQHMLGTVLCPGAPGGNRVQKSLCPWGLDSGEEINDGLGVRWITCRESMVDVVTVFKEGKCRKRGGVWGGGLAEASPRR